MLILVLMSAYFSATETAFTSINKTRLKSMAEKGNKKANLVLSISENYDKLLSTILVGNNIVNIALSSLATLMFIKISQEYGAREISRIINTEIKPLLVDKILFGKLKKGGNCVIDYVDNKLTC